MNRYRRFASRLAGLGVKRAVSTVSSTIARRYYEHKFQIQTSEHVNSVGGPFCVPYWPTDYVVLARFMRWLPVTQSDVFVDYGSGMGRVLVFAATRPFKKVIGVEISRQLNAIADANIRRARRKLRCQDIEIVCCDASEYRLPDDASVLFFFNPFRGPILKRVFQEIDRSLNSTPRQLRVLYYNPPDSWQSEAECSDLQSVKEMHSSSGFKLHLYKYS
jgi:predicted RNA methylase